MGRSGRWSQNPKGFREAPGGLAEALSAAMRRPYGGRTRKRPIRPADRPDGSAADPAPWPDVTETEFPNETANIVAAGTNPDPLSGFPFRVSESRSPFVRIVRGDRILLRRRHLTGA